MPKRAHPLVRFLFAEMIRQNTSLAEVAQRSGVSRESISAWRYNRQPDLGNLEAALRVLDYELRPVLVGDDDQVSLEDRLRLAGFKVTWAPPKRGRPSKKAYDADSQSAAEEET